MKEYKETRTFIQNINREEIKVDKAWFPFNTILWIFYIIYHKLPFHEVAMINPFTLNIVTIGDEWIDKKMFRHEYRHIQQVKKLGRIKFLFYYLYYNLKYGYEKNPFEIDANMYQENKLTDDKFYQGITCIK